MARHGYKEAPTEMTRRLVERMYAFGVGPRFVARCTGFSSSYISKVGKICHVKPRKADPIDLLPEDLADLCREVRAAQQRLVDDLSPAGDADSYVVQSGRVSASRENARTPPRLPTLADLLK